MATPLAIWLGASLSTALAAPRALNAPTFWKFSHLKNNSQPAISSIAEEVRIGVWCTNGAIRRAADRMSCRLGMCGLSMGEN